MKIASISPNIFRNNNLNIAPPPNSRQTNAPTFNAPLSYIDCVNFTAADTRRVSDIDYFSYKQMSDTRKQFLRKKCLEFNKEVEASTLENAEKNYLPLMQDRDMEAFIKVCDMYRGLKNEPILCLGRSPKWFLNTALWMKDGIDDYKFVPFSKYWYRYDRYEQEYKKIPSAVPTDDEKKAYKKYLKSLRADPKHIVDVHEKTGKKIVITDYISSGKGACSFLDIMSEFAEEDGILEEFAKSIRIVGIGCLEYQERFYHEDEMIPIPTVPLPERLWPYEKEIQQDYQDMPISVFEQMLINENSNECRSTYYPHEAWTVYKPKNYFKTGKINESKLAELKAKQPKSFNNFTPAMKDFRNLLNFRILDYLSEHDLLRENLNSKQWD